MDHQRESWAEMPALIAAVQAVGDKIGLPYLAAQGDLGDPEPMSDEVGRPYAETSFKWYDPTHRYWRDRKLALHVAFLTAARLTAEPFFYSDGRLQTWRATGLLDAVDCEQAKNSPLFGEAIVAPVHLPRGLVGSLVAWQYIRRVHGAGEKAASPKMKRERKCASKLTMQKAEV